MNTRDPETRVRRTTRKRWRVVAFIVLVVALLWALWQGAGDGNATRFGGHALHSFVDSDSPGEVIVAGRKFAFPRRYFWGFMGPTSGIAKTVNLMALLPGIEPYSEENKAEFTGCLGWCRRVTISISESVKPWHFTNFSRELAEWSRMIPFDPEKARSSFSGLQYHWLIDPNHTSTWRSLPEEGYFYSCSPLRTPKPSCTVDMDYDERVTVEITFSKEYLSDLPQIVARIKTFLINHQK